MTVSWRNILTAGAGIAAISFAGMAFAQSAGQVVTVPGVTVGSTSSTTTATCCDQGKVHGVYAPGVTVPSPNLVINQATSTVGSQYIIESSTTLGSGVTVSGADTRTTFLSNRSYIPMADPIEPSSLNLNVAGSTLVTEVVSEQVPVQQEVCVDKIVTKVVVAPIRAVCLDDTGTPHPASQVDDAQNVSSQYEGEVFRCVAGTSMQVTIGELVNGQADFSQAGGFSCAKGEALVHLPGGKLTCAPQAPQRNCNERSLLRKYGPGLKLIETAVNRKVCEPAIQTSYETVQREVVKEVPLPPKPITLDGGVGQIVTY